MSYRKIVTRTLFVVVVMPLALLLVLELAIQPAKYGYLRWRVEAAKTASEEREAFKLAADWGRVWEVNRLSTRDVASDGIQIAGNWLLQLEWLPSSPYTGRAYVAYRAVIDTNNLRILWDKKY